MRDLHRQLAITALASALAACGGSEAAESGGFQVTDSAGVVLVRNPAEPADSALAPRLVPDLRIGVVEGPVEYQFHQIVHADEGAFGEIYVLDRSTLNVRVFDAEGTYLRTIGREGQGPGEFTRPTALRLMAGDTLLVLEGETRGGRLHVFAPDGTFIQTHTFGTSGIVSGWEISPAGHAFMEVSRRAEALPGLLLRLDRHTAAIHTVSELLPAISSEAPVSYGPGPRWTVLEDGRLVIGRTDEYRLVVQHAEGGVERVVTRNVAPSAILESVKARALESLRTPDPRMTAGLPPEAAELIAERQRQRGLNATVADHYPHYFSIWGGPRGSLWAMRFPQYREPDEPWDGMHPYDVFDAEGRHLGTVKIQASYPGPWGRGEHLYLIVRDELGVSYLERLRIEWGRGG